MVVVGLWLSGMPWLMWASCRVWVGVGVGLTQEHVRGFPHATTYTDPATEPADNALARVALERIGDHSPTDEFPTGQYR